MAQQLYSLYDSDRIIYCCQMFEEGQQPENATTLMVTTPMAKPVLNAAGTEIVDMATAEESAEYEAALPRPPAVLVNDDGIYLQDITTGDYVKVILDNGTITTE